jgi:hypothetical protein
LSGYFNAINKIVCTTKHTAADFLLLSGDAVNKFLNENWRVLYTETGKDLSMLVGKMVFSIFKEAAKTVPFRELFNDVE